MENKSLENKKTDFEQMEELIQTTGPVNLFRLFINPKDFGQSVENLWYLSRLIHEGQCELQMNSEEEPLICE